MRCSSDCQETNQLEDVALNHYDLKSFFLVCFYAVSLLMHIKWVSGGFSFHLMQGIIVLQCKEIVLLAFFEAEPDVIVNILRPLSSWLMKSKSSTKNVAHYLPLWIHHKEAPPDIKQRDYRCALEPAG